jgi:hypothetical protein
MKFDQWLETGRGKTSADPESIHLDPKQSVYLRNRLFWAFRAGEEEGISKERKRIREGLENLFGLGRVNHEP